MPKAVRKKAPSYEPTKPEPTLAVLLRIPAKPHPKGRPRFFARGKFVSVYTDAKTKAYEAEVRRIGIEAFDGHAPFSGAVEVVMTAVFDRPKSKARTAKHTSRPDLDNLAKAVLDGLNGVAYNDDAQIVSLCVYKRYAEGGEPQGTDVRLYPATS